MGFFGLADQAPPKQRSATSGINIEELREQSCKLCPLNEIDCRTPKMKPQGSKEPAVYILGDAPSRASDKQGVPFGGDVGNFIRARIPGKWINEVRWGNVVQDPTGPGDQVQSLNRDDPKLLTYNKAPSQIAIECCRNRVEGDILKYRPKVVITIHKVALYWIAKETHAYLWEGRRFPAQIGDHKFWVYPFRHPYDVMKDRRWDGFVGDEEAAWSRHFKAVFKDLEDIEAPAVHTEKTARKNVSWVMGDEGSSDLRKIEKHIEKCVDHGEVGMDYETNQLRPYNEDSKILTAALDIPGAGLAFPFDHKEAKWTSKQRGMLDDMWYDFLTEPKVEKIAHQLAFEMEWSAVKYGPEVCRDTGLWQDTISQAYIINPRQGMLALENLTQQYWGLNLKLLSDVNRKNMGDEPLIKILPYNGMDSKYHRKLHEVQMPILRERDQIDQYLHQLARIPTLVLTQMQGVPVDQKVLRKLRGPWEQEQAEALDDLKQLKCWDKYRKTHGNDYNPASQHDTVKMLKLLGFKTNKTDEKTMREIDHPFSTALIKWRKPTKVLSTYCDPVTAGAPDNVVHDDGLLHPIISAYKVETWRTSSEEPNQQNWPKRGKNVIIRRVVRKDNYKIVTFDYAGIQARNIAMESRDEAFAQAFFDWYDIHSEWVREFATTYPKWAPKNWETDKDVFKKCRDTAKTYFVFPSFFGAKPKSITPNMNAIGRKDLRVEEVEEMQDRLFTRFPKIKRWQIGLEKFYKKHGYVTGLSGFRRYAPVSWNQLINSPIQADESVIVLSAMNALSELNFKKYQASMEIHDDLTFIWPEHLVEKRSEIVIREMLKIRFDWINVPLVVERSIGDNWCDLEKAGNFESVGTDDWREVKDK